MSKPFDLLSEFAKFGATRQISLRDPATRDAFGLHVGQAINTALADPRLMHGQRVEAMFESLLVSLGQYRLLKAEDTGRVFPTDKFRVPDFRVVLKDGEQWLIEVKNVYEPEPGVQKRKLMTREYREGLEAYATATGAKLKLAVYWARWSMWTLVSPERLVNEAGELVLDMFTAGKANEFGRLGDMTIGTRPPLCFRLMVDQSKPNSISANDMADFTIGGAKIFCDDKEVTNPAEQEIAWVFMQYGEWSAQKPRAVMEGGKLIGIEAEFNPRTRGDQDFEFIGSLSRMFAGYYAELTLKDGAIVQIQAPLRPDWFPSLIHEEYKGETLPLWRFILQSNYQE